MNVLINLLYVTFYCAFIVFTIAYISHRHSKEDKRVYLKFSEFKMYYNLNPDRYKLLLAPKVSTNRYNGDKYIIFNYFDFFKYFIFSVKVSVYKKHCIYANNKEEYIKSVIPDVDKMREKAKSEMKYTNEMLEKINNNLSDNK